MPATTAEIYSAGSGVEMSKPVGVIGSVPADSAEAEEQPLLSRGLANSSNSRASAGQHGKLDLLQGPHMIMQSPTWEASQLRCWSMLGDTSKNMPEVGGGLA